jgi:hypothetical protein
LDSRVDAETGKVPGGATARGVEDLGLDEGKGAVVDGELVGVDGGDGEEVVLEAEEGCDEGAE